MPVAVELDIHGPLGLAVLRHAEIRPVLLAADGCSYGIAAQRRFAAQGELTVERSPVVCGQFLLGQDIVAGIPDLHLYGLARGNRVARIADGPGYSLKVDSIAGPVDRSIRVDVDLLLPRVEPIGRVEHGKLIAPPARDHG